MPQRVAARCHRPVGLSQCLDGRARAEAGGRCADARQPDQAGDDAEGRCPADAASRHDAQQHARGLSRLPLIPALALRRQGLGEGGNGEGGLGMSLSELTDERPVKRTRPSGKRRRTQAERTQETRTRILDAAVKVLRQKGYAHFRTADVAKAAGVSRGAQLHHFATKEALVYATMEHVFHNVLETSRARARALRPGDDPLERAIADAREFFFSTAFFISLDIATSINRRRFREKLMAMVRDARLPAERAWREALAAQGVPDRVADDVLWLTFGL